MKKLMILALCAGAVNANAEAVTAVKIAYVNYEAAVAQENDAAQAFKEIEAEEKKIVEAQQKAEADVQKKWADFQKDASKLSEKAKADKQAAFTAEVTKLQQDIADRGSRATKKRQDLFRDLENKNRLLVESIALKEGYSMVLNSAALVYASAEMKKHDLTTKLVAEYNKTYPVKKAVPAKKSAK